MKNFMTYNGYRGSIHYSDEDKIFYGEIIGIKDDVSFEGDSVQEITEDFHEAVDHYLLSCKKIGKTPDREFKGSFNVRISPDLHKKAYFIALDRGITLNKFFEESVSSQVNEEEIQEGYSNYIDKEEDRPIAPNMNNEVTSNVLYCESQFQKNEQEQM